MQWICCRFSLVTQRVGVDLNYFQEIREMITGCKDSDNMMLVVELVVVFMVNIAMVKVVIKVMEEQCKSKQPDCDLRSLFHLFVMITGHSAPEATQTSTKSPQLETRGIKHD